jgi:hypothetical protein
MSPFLLVVDILGIFRGHYSNNGRIFQKEDSKKRRQPMFNIYTYGCPIKFYTVNKTNKTLFTPDLQYTAKPLPTIFLVTVKFFTALDFFS